MGFMQKISMKIQSFMRTRYGADQLSQFLTWAALVLLLLGAFLTPILTIIGYACFIWAIVRMLSKNPAARRKENQWYLNKSWKIKTAVKQFIARVKNSKEYKYFRCPKCHSYLKLKRGAGEGTVTCGKCGNTFRKKA